MENSTPIMKPKMLAMTIAGVLATLALVFSQNQIYAQENTLGVCCAWNTKVVDGLSYRISGGGETAQAAVQAAIDDWNAENTGITLVPFAPVSKKDKPDVDIKFKLGGGTIAGQTLRQFDNTGFVKSVRLSISGQAFGDPNNADIIEQITKHELGHALGLGHADFDGDLMSTTVQGGTNVISACDKDGVIQANHWFIVDGVGIPHAPHVSSVTC